MVRPGPAPQVGAYPWRSPVRVWVRLALLPVYALRLWSPTRAPVHPQALAARPLAADPRAEKALVALLAHPLEHYDVVTVLGLSRYPGLMGLLQLSTRKEMAVRIVEAVLKNDTKVRTQGLGLSPKL